MPPDVEPEIIEMKVSEVRNVAVSFVGKLDDGELLTGTPLVVEITSTDLTLVNKVISTAALTINGKSVAIGEAVQFKVSTPKANINYDVRLTATTDSTPAQTLIATIRIRGKAD